MMNIQIQNFLKIHAVGTELFHADGRTDGQLDITKLIIALRNFSNAPQNPSNVLKEDQISRLFMDLYSAA